MLSPGRRSRDRFAAWLADRLIRKPAQLVEADARALIEEHSIQAYGVARWRAHQLDREMLVDESRPAGHWSAVSLRVPTLTDTR